jgi:hypothetical protein
MLCLSLRLAAARDLLCNCYNNAVAEAPQQRAHRISQFMNETGAGQRTHGPRLQTCVCVLLSPLDRVARKLAVAHMACATQLGFNQTLEAYVGRDACLPLVSNSSSIAANAVTHTNKNIQFNFQPTTSRYFQAARHRPCGAVCERFEVACFRHFWDYEHLLYTR